MSSTLESLRPHGHLGWIWLAGTHADEPFLLFDIPFCTTFIPLNLPCMSLLGLCNSTSSLSTSLALMITSRIFISLSSKVCVDFWRNSFPLCSPANKPSNGLAKARRARLPCVSSTYCAYALYRSMISRHGASPDRGRHTSSYLRGPNEMGCPR